eukprot:scaffold2868_cov171-Amphora_coffeaeformis.AAC.20
MIGLSHIIVQRCLVRGQRETNHWDRAAEKNGSGSVKLATSHAVSENTEISHKNNIHNSKILRSWFAVEISEKREDY